MAKTKTKAKKHALMMKCKCGYMMSKSAHFDTVVGDVCPRCSGAVADFEKHKLEWN